MKWCYRMAEIQEDCRRLANVETGEKETPLGETETPLGEKVTKVGEKANFVGEKKIIGSRVALVSPPSSSLPSMPSSLAVEEPPRAGVCVCVGPRGFMPSPEE